jgi:cellulose synthase/poly-beta-1,6-N-acetylglucosamine synthase-like glycosyltransferase
MDDLSGQILFAPVPRPPLPLSVVVVARHGGEALERCLRALLRQDLAVEYEIVIADPRGNADTLRIVGNRAARARPQLRYLSTRRGDAAARNAGWQDAAGEIVAFTDDGSVPRRSWLRRGHAAFAHADTLALAGCVRERDGANCVGESRLSTANCFLRRDVLRSLGGFDERFRNGGDQVELMLTLERWGAIEDGPEAIVVREPRPQAKPLWQRVGEALRAAPDSR